MTKYNTENRLLGFSLSAKSFVDENGGLQATITVQNGDPYRRPAVTGNDAVGYIIYKIFPYPRGPWTKPLRAAAIAPVDYPKGEMTYDINSYLPDGQDTLKLRPGKYQMAMTLFFGQLTVKGTHIFIVPVSAIPSWEETTS